MVKGPVPRRGPPAKGLHRRVKPRFEAEPDSEPEIEESPAASEDEAPSEQGLSEDDEEMGGDAESGEDDESEDERPSKSAKLDIANVSFGALAKAQASMPTRKRRRGQTDPSPDSEADEDDDRHTASHHAKRAALAKRTSKHAPTEMSSKRRVSRRRDFDVPAKPAPRDPRFDAAINASNPSFDEHRARKAYAFLDDYRASEMADLRAQIKKTKDAAEKERLQRELLAMQNRKKAADRKDHERRIIEEHRRQEKELVKQGKQPFYLKKSEQKKRLLTEQFQSMKKRQVDKSIERKRKKVAGREKKELDRMQRRT